MVKVVIFNQQSMTYYVSTIDFKVQFMQVYGVIQNYMYLTIFGRDLIRYIAAIAFLVFLIVSNIVSYHASRNY